MYEISQNNRERSALKTLLIKGLTVNQGLRSSVAKTLVNEVVDNHNLEHPNADLVVAETLRLWNEVFKPLLDVLVPEEEEDV